MKWNRCIAVAMTQNVHAWSAKMGGRLAKLANEREGKKVQEPKKVYVDNNITSEPIICSLFIRFHSLCLGKYSIAFFQYHRRTHKIAQQSLKIVGKTKTKQQFYFSFSILFSFICVYVFGSPFCIVWCPPSLLLLHLTQQKNYHIYSNRIVCISQNISPPL